jgi:tripartite-type tricarboxylate transporter receptor subunit TctC
MQSFRDPPSAFRPGCATPEQFGAFLKSETEKWLRVSKAAGIYQSQ